MNASTDALEQLDPGAFQFYRHAMRLIEEAGISFLVGGAYAFGFYTGIARHTKDFDLFVRQSDVDRILGAAAAANYRAEILFSHWLGKIHHGDDFVDLIFSSGNGMCPVDDGWFEHAQAGKVLGAPARLIAAEEMIWQKAYIMERERFDGADVNHLIRARGKQLDWDRLLTRFGPHWRVLLSQLILFGYVYPDERDNVPAEVLSDLVGRLGADAPTCEHLCMGTLLSRTQYLTDIEEWGYGDPRLAPAGPITREQLAPWTEAGRPA